MASPHRAGRRKNGGVRRPVFRARRPVCRLLLFLVCILLGGLDGRLRAAETNAVTANPVGHFNIRGYTVAGHLALDTNTLAAIFAPHTGTNIEIKDIVAAAAGLQAENLRQGHPPISVATMPEHLAGGVLTLNIFQATVPQIVVSGERYLPSGERAAATAEPPNLPAEEAVMPAANTNVAPTGPVVKISSTPATPEEITSARAALFQAMAELAAREKDTHIHVVSTNAGPRFEVDKYLVMDNSILPPLAIGQALTNIDGAFGTNVSLDGVRMAVRQLQRAYRDRGYLTVSVGLPPQKLTNATVKLQVTEGRLADIFVKGNQYFSSNNVMRALPSLHPGQVLNGLIFQAELNRANVNRDRQIYPLIEPGPDPGTSDLALTVKDRLPLHAKVELNNQSTPGTPDLRLNTSAVYDNLWQHEHSLGLQYSFSPQSYKTGPQWNFYDQPTVANYSAFYRLPLGNPEALADVVANNSDSFGYNEATRKFNLPPTSGRPALTAYASRSTIDTGLLTLSDTTVLQNPVRTLSLQTVQQDTTVNENLGFRLNKSVSADGNLRSAFSGGMDYKIYDLASHKTNVVTDVESTVDKTGKTVTSTFKSYSPVPSATGVTINHLEYLPLALNYDASWRTSRSTVSLGLGASGNAWYAGSRQNLQTITGSSQSTGHWVALDPSLSVDVVVYPNWVLSLHANGQWASEPLISNEQFGAGGVNSVRGYHEGEAFGDDGWHFSIEQRTPSHLVGTMDGGVPVTLRGSVYFDAARVYLIDPQGRAGSTALMGVGFGGVAAVGSHWEARLLFSLPLLSTLTTPAYQPFFNFSLTAQF